MPNYSPLRYPGGKGKLALYLSSILDLNGLEGGHYAEPFAGGAAVAFDLLLSEKVRHIHINDLDWAVYAFWASVINHTDALVAKIRETEVTVDEWIKAREVKRRPLEHDLVEVGFATFFLNRTNRSGILNGGIIGGLSQEGSWKIDCRFNKEELIQRIRRIGLYRSRISLTNLDASDFLSNNVAGLGRRCLTYIDPPYYIKGAYLYQNHFVHADHVALADIVRGLTSTHWLVSYDNVDQIRRIYADFDQEAFDIGYSARNHNKGSEVMIFGPDLARPDRVYATKKELLIRLKSAAGDGLSMEEESVQACAEVS